MPATVAPAWVVPAALLAAMNPAKVIDLGWDDRADYDEGGYGDE